MLKQDFHLYLINIHEKNGTKQKEQSRSPDNRGSTVFDFLSNCYLRMKCRSCPFMNLGARILGKLVQSKLIQILCFTKL